MLPHKVMYNFSHSRLAVGLAVVFGITFTPGSAVGVDAELAAIIEGCLEPLSQFRYADTEEVLADLDRRHPGIRFRMIDEQNRIRRHISFVFTIQIVPERIVIRDHLAVWRQRVQFLGDAKTADAR